MLLGWAILIFGMAHPGASGHVALAQPPATDPSGDQSPPTAPEPADDLTWGVQPAADGGAATRPAFSYQLDPGATISDAVRITNSSEVPVTLHISSHDAFNTDSGDFSVVTAEQPSSDLGTWVTLAATEVTIPAREYVDVAFDLVVPSNATPGDHAGGIVAAMSVERERGDGTPVTVEHRVGSRIYARISGDLRPALTVAELTTRFDGEGIVGLGGAAVVDYTVRNTGNIRLAAGQALRVSGWFGTGSTATLDDLPELLPGGSYSGSVTLDSVRATGRLTGELSLAPSDPSAGVTVATAVTWAVPWRLLGLVAVLAVAGAWRLRTRHPRADRAPDDDADEDAPVDATDGTVEPPGRAAARRPAARTPNRLAALAVLSLAPFTGPGPGPTAPPVTSAARAQSVALDRTSAGVGEPVVVELAGWQIGPAHVELCGNDGRRGSIDCDVSGAAAAGIDAEGAGRVTLTVGAPPVACPCVVRVSQPSTGATATVPFAVAGLPPAAGVTDLALPAPPRLELVDVVIERDEGSAAVFGADAGREVAVTVRNAGSVVLSDVTINAQLFGRGAGGSTIAGPPPFDLAPGEQTTTWLRFTLPFPALGDYRIAGRIAGDVRPLEFTVATSHVPWGLINSTGIALATAGLVTSRRHARRRHVPVLGAA